MDMMTMFGLGISMIICISSLVGAVIWMKQQAGKRSSKREHDEEMYDTMLLQLADGLDVEFKNKTNEQAANHIRKTRPNYKVLMQPSIDDNAFWNANKGYILIFHGKPADRVTSYTIGYESASIEVVENSSPV